MFTYLEFKNPQNKVWYMLTTTGGAVVLRKHMRKNHAAEVQEHEFRANLNLIANHQNNLAGPKNITLKSGLSQYKIQIYPNQAKEMLEAIKHFYLVFDEETLSEDFVFIPTANYTAFIPAIWYLPIENCLKAELY